MDATKIIPITKARANLSTLTQQAKGRDYIVLTKGGEAKAALVDIKYLQQLEAEIKNLYGKTFIDPKLLPFTRDFFKKEIDEWEKEDVL